MGAIWGWEHFGILTVHFGACFASCIIILQMVDMAPKEVGMKLYLLVFNIWLERLVGKALKTNSASLYLSLKNLKMHAAENSLDRLALTQR